MKQTLVKKYTYEGYSFNFTVILDNELIEEVYYHQVISTGKDYFEAIDCNSAELSETLTLMESNIDSFVDEKLSVSDEEALLLEKGFQRVSY